jgi:LemA protein
MVLSLILGVLIALAVTAAVMFVYYYNNIVVLGNRIDNAWSQIDVQLKKRADLVPNLVETVKGYAKHEKTVFTEVTNARSAWMKAATPQEKAKAGNMLTDALKSIFAVAENYPQLKASENFKMLQEEISGIENKIAYARQFYNDSILKYNNTVTTIPGMWFASILGKTEQKQYYEIKAIERENVKVAF